MSQIITVEVPDQLMQQLNLSAEDVAEEIVELGIYQLKVRRALALYEAGTGSLGYIAEQLDLDKVDLIREAHLRGLEPPFDDQAIQEELGI
ncbi:MAG: hypothetical protein KF893_26575 [Caldilineaceae bacterium]|nr:hypothetical protein [Caldilineaceae bacterium]